MAAALRGRKPTKYFLNLENRNSVSKHIRKLKIENKNILKPTEICKVMKDFYENLYKEKESTDINNTNFEQIANNVTKLNEEHKLNIEREISLEDLKHIVFKSKNNKSPGPDGYSNKFYKIFWDQIKILLLKLMNFYRHNRDLNKAQLNRVITCIPKGGKVRNDLKNWRPITLLDSIYNFFFWNLGGKNQIILPKFIGDNTRLIYDIAKKVI